MLSAILMDEVDAVRTFFLQAERNGMKTLDLPRKYDVLTCFFTSINYNTSKKELRKTLKAFYETLREGGVVIFDLGLTSDEFGDCNLDIHSEGSLQLARVMQWVPSREKEDIINVNSLILVKENGEINFETDQHTLGRFSVKTVKKLMGKEGFEATVYDGLSMERYSDASGRPVFVGKKPHTSHP